MNSLKKTEKLKSEIEKLEKKIKEKELSLPAHSIKSGMIKELEEYKTSGIKVVLVSSAYQPFVDRFADHIGADSIGSTLIYEGNKLTGVKTPVNAYQKKADNILARFKNERITAAYGDTMSDLPMMELSEEPVAVTPSAELRKIAEHRGWRIIEGQD